MEQGFIAVGIGLLIALISYINGFTNGLRNGKSQGLSAGIKLGSLHLFGILIKTKLLAIELENGKSTYTLHGNKDTSLTMAELLDIVDYQRVSTVENDHDSN